MLPKNTLRIPYGITDINVIIREGYYYVDKTRFIRQLESEGRFVVFLRPRRYGKSLTIAMLEYYYGLNYADRFEGIFGGLDIGKEPTELHNTYLMLSLNFSNVDPDPDKVQASFNYNLLLALRRFAYRYSSILPAGTEDALQKSEDSNSAFNYLCEQTAKTDRKMYVIIDEYDNFANTLMTYDEGAYRNLTHGDGFFRLFFNSLKYATTGADAVVDRLFISGVSPLTLSDVTSGFNIGENYSMRSAYNEMVGFTETEVRTMLEYYDKQTGMFQHTVDELLELMRPWYNNNCFSSRSLQRQRMFNSDMVLYFIKNYLAEDGTLPDSMIDPNVHSDYGKMRKMVKLEQTFGPKAQTLQQIANDGYIVTSLKSEFSLSELHNVQNLPSLLYYMGMLTYGLSPDGDLALVVPNLVVREQYYKYMDECYTKNLDWQMELWEYDRLGQNMARRGEGEALLRFVAEQMRENSSTRDFDAKAESFVKGFMLAKLGSMVTYFVSTTEPEMNHGYADLYLEPLTEQYRHAYIIELKYCPSTSSDAEVARLRQDAIDQANRYVAAKQLQQRADARGWELHRLALVFRGWKLAHLEEVR